MSGSGIVTFVYADWLAVYPEFTATATAAQGQNDFDIATLFLDNTECSPVQDVTRRTSLLYMITAHVAQLYQGSSGPGGSTISPIVGRVSQATEGSVSISSELAGMGKNEAWWVQTKYGLMAWQAMAPYRAGKYYPPPQIPLAAQSWPGGAFGGVWGYPAWRR